MSDFVLRTTKGFVSPVYMQISDFFRREIYSGRLTSGVTLPSARELAIKYKIDPMTVSKAMRILSAEGLLIANPGRRYIVSKVDVSITKKLEIIAGDLQELVTQAGQLCISDDELLALVSAALKKS